ncbi:hypothetical protein O71_16030 [Pontibacter sp. BAB1700]|nr:hypothetical protein O71_16030 [Pontibacter sp. BAB1700]
MLQSTLHFQSPDKNQVVLSVTPQQLKLHQTSLKLQGVFVAVVPASVALDKIPDLLARFEAIPA